MVSRESRNQKCDWVRGYVFQKSARGNSWVPFRATVGVPGESPHPFSPHDARPSQSVPARLSYSCCTLLAHVPQCFNKFGKFQKSLENLDAGVEAHSLRESGGILFWIFGTFQTSEVGTIRRISETLRLGRFAKKGCLGILPFLACRIKNYCGIAALVFSWSTSRSADFIVSFSRFFSRRASCRWSIADQSAFFDLAS